MNAKHETEQEISEKQDLINHLFWNNSVELLRMAQPLINQYVLRKMQRESKITQLTKKDHEL